MPTGFLPNPVSPTRRLSHQTRWKKTSFALARLRPSSEYADGLLTESRLANPTAIVPNPMGKVSQNFQDHRCIYAIYDIYILIIGTYILYINISMRFKQKKQSLGDLCKIPLFTFSLTARTQTQVFGYFPPPIPPVLPKYPLNPPPNAP